MGDTIEFPSKKPASAMVLSIAQAQSQKFIDEHLPLPTFGTDKRALARLAYETAWRECAEYAQELLRDMLDVAG